MKILIMRHGEAEHFGFVDEDRKLTQNGIAQSNKTAKLCLQKKVVHFDHVLVSPYCRAQQTWETVKPYFSSDLIENCDDITPYGDASEVVEYLCALLHSQPNIESLLLISHLPLVSYLVAELTKERTPIAFSTATMACVEFDMINQKGTLDWVIKA